MRMFKLALALTAGLGLILWAVAVPSPPPELTEADYPELDRRAVQYESITVETELIETEPAETEPVEVWEYIGEFKVSHYSPSPDENGGYSVTCTGDNLADGVGLWCAANKKDIPLGSVIRIEGLGELLVNDTGVRQGVLDVLVSDKKTAYDMGVYRAGVWVRVEEGA